MLHNYVESLVAQSIEGYKGLNAKNLLLVQLKRSCSSSKSITHVILLGEWPTCTLAYARRKPSVQVCTCSLTNPSLMRLAKQEYLFRHCIRTSKGTKLVHACNSHNYSKSYQTTRYFLRDDAHVVLIHLRLCETSKAGLSFQGSQTQHPKDMSDSSPSPPESPSDDLEYATPWPDNTYIIIERSSGRAIAVIEGKLCLYDYSEREEINIKWQCVERNGYFAFLNTKLGVYLGHNGGETCQASATTLDAWEYVTPRKHPDGGYQLLTPHWWNKLLLIEVAEDGNTLVRRSHGTTVWEFIKV